MVHRDLKPENLLYADLSLDAPLKIGNTTTTVHKRHDNDMHVTCASLAAETGDIIVYLDYISEY